MTTRRQGWLRSLVTDEHGEFDTGRFGIIVLIGLILGAVPIILGVSIAAWWLKKPFDPQPLGIAIGAICGGFSTALGALGLYLLGDKRQSGPLLPAPNIAQQVNVAAAPAIEPVPIDTPAPAVEPPTKRKLQPLNLPR